MESAFGSCEMRHIWIPSSRDQVESASTGSAPPRLPMDGRAATSPRLPRPPFTALASDPSIPVDLAALEPTPSVLPHNHETTVRRRAAGSFPASPSSDPVDMKPVPSDSASSGPLRLWNISFRSLVVNDGAGDLVTG